jgi:hypothetical protein
MLAKGGKALQGDNETAFNARCARYTGLIHPSLWGITSSKAEGRTVHRTVLCTAFSPSVQTFAKHLSLLTAHCYGLADGCRIGYIEKDR